MSADDTHPLDPLLWQGGHVPVQRKIFPQITQTELNAVSRSLDRLHHLWTTSKRSVEQTIMVFPFFFSRDFEIGTAWQVQVQARLNMIPSRAARNVYVTNDMHLHVGVSHLCAADAMLAVCTMFQQCIPLLADVAAANQAHAQSPFDFAGPVDRSNIVYDFINNRVIPWIESHGDMAFDVPTIIDADNVHETILEDFGLAFNQRRVCFDPGHILGTMLHQCTTCVLEGVVNRLTDPAWRATQGPLGATAPAGTDFDYVPMPPIAGNGPIAAPPAAPVLPPAPGPASAAPASAPAPAPAPVPAPAPAPPAVVPALPAVAPPPANAVNPMMAPALSAAITASLAPGAQNGMVYGTIPTFLDYQAQGNHTPPAIAPRIDVLGILSRSASLTADQKPGYLTMGGYRYLCNQNANPGTACCRNFLNKGDLMAHCRREHGYDMRPASYVDWQVAGPYNTQELTVLRPVHVFNLRARADPAHMR